MKNLFIISGIDLPTAGPLIADRILKYFHYKTFILIPSYVDNSFKEGIMQETSYEICKNWMEGTESKVKLDGINLGLINNDEKFIKLLSDFLARQNIPIIFDPVLKSMFGYSFYKQETIKLICDMIIPYIHILTPNIFEAEILTGIKINNMDDVKNVCVKICSMGVNAVIIRGFHSNDKIQNILYDNKSFKIFSKEQQNIEFMELKKFDFFYSTVFLCNFIRDQSYEDAFLNTERYVNRVIRDLCGDQEIISQNKTGNVYFLSEKIRQKNHKGAF